LAWHWDTTGSGTTGFTKSAEVSIPALVKNVDTSVAHGLTGCTKFNYILRTSTNQILVNKIYTDPALPTANFIINSAIDIPVAGTLKCIVTGFN